MTAPLADLVLRPMSGAGVVARFGGVFLVVATEADDAAEPVLGRLVEICRAVSSGQADGRVLVRRLAGLLAATDTDPPAFCTVAPHGDDLIVFVHGDAEVVVRIRGGEQRISGRESVAWVDRLVAWPADELVVTVPGAQHIAARELLDLRSGIVPGAGFWIGAALSAAPGAEGAAGSGSKEASQPLEPLPLLDSAVPGGAPEPRPGDSAAEPVGPAPESVAPAPESVEPAPESVAPTSETVDPAPETVELAKQPASGAPPTFESVLLVGSTATTPLSEDVSDHRETGPLPLAADLPTQSLVTIDVDLPADAIMVGGIYCSRGHFNDPDALYCGVCGIGLVQQTRHVVQGVRPPLGVLVLDDGLTYVLDEDYVIGREPGYDDDVREGRALALAVEDPDGGISRAHAAVRLRGWEVIVCDKGSVNGTYIAPPGESVWTPLTPFQPVTIKPGTRVQVGRRTFVYDSHHHI